MKQFWRKVINGNSLRYKRINTIDKKEITDYRCAKSYRELLETTKQLLQKKVSILSRFSTGQCVFYKFPNVIICFFQIIGPQVHHMAATVSLK